MGASARFQRATIAAVSLALVTTAALPGESARTAVPSKPDDKTIVHVLNRIGFGPGPGDLERVRRMGLEKYIEQQLHPERLPDEAVASRIRTLTTLTKSTEELSQDYFMPARRAQQQARNASGTKPEANAETTRREMRTPEQAQAMQGQRQVFTDLAQQKILRAAYSERQLNEVMVDFWFNHFNVFAGKGQTRVYLTEYERDTIRPHLFGKFRDLLGAVAESPAMLFYLDNWQSAAPEGASTEMPLRNPRGVNPGTRQPGSRNPAAGQPGIRNPAARQPRTIADLPPRANQRARGLNENYARELMELHTLGVDGGYTQKDVQEVARALTGWTIANPRQGGSFRYEPRMHDDGEKIVLGHRIKAGGGKKDGEQVLDLLAKHPSTARFIATKLARRFVADVPPPALVDRAAARFRETDGDIREVVRTIITSPEFFAADANRAKVKSPFEFVVSAVRATGADVVNAMPLVQAVDQLGMPLYRCQPPTGYADRADAWVNTGALLNRMNFAVSLTSARGRGIRPSGATLNADVTAVRDTLIDGVLAGEVSEATRSTVARATEPQQAVALLLGSPEFQKR
jgi:uncharacterized protein (DUF1800 family)